MMTPHANPPQSPTREQARLEVKGPAIALVIVSLIAIVLGTIGIGIDVLLILSGGIERLEAMNEGPISEYTIITVRTAWGIILLIAAVFILYGSLKMQKLLHYRFAMTAAIVSLIPGLGPCCVCGIPFGIWTLSVLARPHVKAAFNEQSLT